VRALWVNGRLVEPAARVRGASDPGFTLGDGLFETMRVLGGKGFRLAEHLARLRSSASRVDLRVPENLERGIREAVAAGGGGSGALRLTLTRGEAPPGLRIPEGAEGTLVLALHPLPARERQGRDGVSGVVAGGRIDERASTTGLKHLGYLGAVLAQREADAAGADDALLLNTAGNLAEAAAANLFLVSEGRLFTPSLACGALPGITRALVLELAAAAGIPHTEEPLAPSRLDGADEAFLTSSLRGLEPLVSVGGRPLGDGRPGPLTRRLQLAYLDLLHAECGG
jgi:branched-chain amino acid aminotransferase